MTIFGYAWYGRTGHVTAKHSAVKFLTKKMERHRLNL
jgi:hypothetical protein